MTVARSRRSASGLLLLTPHETEKSSDYCINCEAGGVSGCLNTISILRLMRKVTRANNSNWPSVCTKNALTTL